jgi:hypothetical protein
MHARGLYDSSANSQPLNVYSNLCLRSKILRQLVQLAVGVGSEGMLGDESPSAYTIIGVVTESFVVSAN